MVEIADFLCSIAPLKQVLLRERYNTAYIVKTHFVHVPDGTLHVLGQVLLQSRRAGSDLVGELVDLLHYLVQLGTKARNSVRAKEKSDESSVRQTKAKNVVYNGKWQL